MSPYINQPKIQTFEIKVPNKIYNNINLRKFGLKQLLINS